MEATGSANQKYQVGRTQKVLLLSTLTLLYLLNFADRSVLSAVLQPMKIALNLTDTQLGIVQSVFNIGVGLMALPASFVVDRWSRRKSLGIMAIIWSIATFATGISRNFIQLLFSRAVVGVGEAGYAIGGIGWLSVVFPRNRKGLVNGIYSLGAVLGTVGGMVLAGYIVTKTGNWQDPFIYFAIPGVLVGVAVFFFKDYATARKENESTFNKKYFADWIKLFKGKAYTLTVIAQTMFGLFYFTYLGFMPALLMRAYGIDAAKATLIVGASALLAIVGAPLGGWLGDKWMSRNKAARPLLNGILFLVFFLSAGAVMLTLGGPLPLVIAFMIVVALATSISTPIGQAIFTDILPISHRVTGIGTIIVFTYLAGASLGPWIVGLISDLFGGGATGLKNGFLFIVPSLLIASIMYLLSAKYYVKESALINDEALAE